ncbi:MAG TPA: mannose-1-phosphate guanylyltransferase [Ornithinimicrobium sp.]|uniref:mannose-1-phosphate guanylyltransferase n=1 Tax=Ornithinimicrobium sp. TaxID=1977084 RepID=UPI002B467B4B|nr:mannose-1-phosphate guanylyltransferase [Ornithinimicrobium sp.]HKJ12659.1 mannose-1-phosphate guanylyltransferase [Ornithinimicrobium sp.]
MGEDAGDANRPDTEEKTPPLPGAATGSGQDGVSDFWAVVPAGGSGTRLWPLSRRQHPKFLLDVTGHGSSLLADTVRRLRPLCGERLKVVTGTDHAAAVREALPGVGADQLLLEPAPRDSLPAIGWAAAWLEHHQPQAVLGSFAADHVVSDHARFEAAVVRAVQVAREGMLVTLGVRPTRPATGFGYIRPGPAYPRPVAGGPATRAVSAFVEKPDAEAAARYVEQGDLWNAGMFVVRARVLMSMIEQWQPQLAASLRSVVARPQDIDRLWPSIAEAAIDTAVAEPAARDGRVAVVEADFAWDDIGDFAALGAHLPVAADHPLLRVGGAESLVTASDTSGLVIASGGRPVVTLGMTDVVVVDTGDAVLVTTRAHVQDVKKVVDSLATNGHGEVL